MTLPRSSLCAPFVRIRIISRWCTRACNPNATPAPPLFLQGLFPLLQPENGHDLSFQLFETTMSFTRSPSLVLVAVIGAFSGWLLWLTMRWGPAMNLDVECRTSPVAPPPSSNALLHCVGESDVLPLTAFIALRLIAAAACVGTWLALVLGAPMRFNAQYAPPSRLAPVAVHFHYMGKLSTFTTLTWTLLSCFTVGAAASSAALAAGFEPHDSPAMRGALTVLWIAYEISLPTAILITSIVSFVLVPLVARAGLDGSNLYSWRAQMMHNANALIVANELLFNRLPIVATHITAPMLWGVCYVVFSWLHLRRTGVVYYPFLDPTLSAATAVPTHVALMVGCGALHLAACAMDATMRNATLSTVALQCLCAYAFVAAISAVDLERASVVRRERALVLKAEEAAGAGAHPSTVHHW